MKSRVKREYKRLTSLAALTVLAALLLDSLWPVVIAMALYIAWTSRQLIRLSDWLSARSGTPPPETRGIWGDFFDQLYHLMRKQQLAQDEINSVLVRGQQSVNALEDVVILIDPKGRMEYWNTSAEQLMGFRAPDDLNAPLTNLLRHPKFIEYLHQGDFREHLEIPAVADPSRTLQIRITEFGEGDQLIMARDVTRIHRLEQMRKDFVANVSHELKTPLTVLKGYLETLLDTIPDEQGRLRRALSQMNGQTQRMEALVTDLLLLAKLEGTEREHSGEVVPLEGLVHRMRENALVLSAEKHHQISVEIPSNVALIGSSAELESAFGNLITNAVKYTPAEGQITIRWQDYGNSATLSVIDNGPGIEPQHLPRLTERFYRPDTSRVTQTGGTGLGLSIVKHVLIRHDARLEIESTVNKGSHFRCRFPQYRVTSVARLPGKDQPANTDHSVQIDE